MTWRARGVCQSVDPEVFFPAPSEPADAAVALCRTCDVQGACLAWALEVGDCHGVWGATTPRERRAMLVAWRSDEFDAFEGAAALRGPLAGDPLSAPGNPLRQHAAEQDVAPRGRVPGQRNGHDAHNGVGPRNGGDVCNGVVPRNGGDVCNGVVPRNGGDVCNGNVALSGSTSGGSGGVVGDETESRLGAGVGISASA